MQNDAEKISRFKKAVFNEVDNETEMELSAARAKAAAIVANANDTILEEMYKMVSSETAKIVSENKKRVSHYSFKAKRDVLLHRRDIVEHFFEGIRSDVLTFTKTNDYKEKLKEMIATGLCEKAFYDGVIIYHRPTDVDVIGEILKAYPTLKAVSDNDILIGGVILFYPQENVYVDKTLDKSFQNQKESFVYKKEIQV